MVDELEQALRDNIKAPAKATGDAGSVEQHPLDKQIEAVRFLNSTKAAKRKGLGIKRSKLVPPGTE